jgi:iron complex outermembrane receptor protein
MKHWLTRHKIVSSPSRPAGNKGGFLKHLLSTLCALLVLAGFAFAQDRTVTGKVTDAANQPIAGVTVHVKGKNVSVATGDDGTFSIHASPGDVLAFSYVGYTAQELKVGNNGAVNVTLAAGSNALNEVVVIGYGTIRKKDLTGSVATVSAKDFQKGMISTPEQLIAGKVAGVSIVSNGGRPGGGSTIRIRGGSSLTASNNPLIVIDGVPLENSAISGAADPLSFINPNDIASFTILKDASAAAIYGTRAANGVIIITTKKGTGGKLRINFTTNESVSSVVKEVDVLTADQFRAIVNAKGTAAQKAMLGTANTDWQKEIYRTAFSTDNNLSFTGGISKLPYRLSIGYSNQNGIVLTDNLQRTSVALVVNPVLLNGNLKVDLNLKGSLENARFAADAIGGAITFDPTQPVMTKSNRFGGYFEWLDPASATGLTNLAGRNPVGILNQTVNRGKPKRSIGNLQLDYKMPFLPDLHANMNLGYDVSEGAGTVFVSDSAASAYIAGGTGGSNNYYKRTKTNTVFDFYLNYVKDIRSIKSRIDATAGYSYNNFLTKIYNYASYYASGTKVPNSDPAFLYDKPENSLISFFGRLNYSYADKYLLTGTIRRDGSSRFGPSNKWGMFPSVAFAWKLKDESFLKDSRTFSDLKLRVGYGITGQQDGINDYDFLSFYGLSAPNAEYQFGNTYYQMYRPGGYNPNLKWEETATTNAALDFGFLNNRITGSIDLYYKKTKDLLNLIPQPAGTNFSAFFIANVGDMENKGVEFNINAEPVRSKTVTWDVAYNITYNKNTITNLTTIPKDKNYRGIQAGGIAGGIGGGFAEIQAVGYAKNTFNLYKQVYDASGKPVEGVFVDKNGDGIINQDDLYKNKTADPKVFMGFSNNVSYNKWSLGFVLRASIGNYSYNNIYSASGQLSQITGNSVLYNASTSYLATGFIGNSNNLLSDYYLQNASFLKMDNLTIGYNAGSIYHKAASLRLSAGIQNVFVVTKYKGLDPEISGGIDNNFYPRPRIYTLGASLDF